MQAEYLILILFCHWVNVKSNYILILNWLIYLYNEKGQCVSTMFVIANILFLNP